MAWKNDGATYGLVAQGFHWTMAALLLLTIPLGFYMVDLKDQALAAKDMNVFAQAAQLFDIHKAIGMTLLGLLLARLAWRLFNPPPPLPAGTGRGLRAAAAVSHGLLYALMLSVPVTGYLLSSAEGFAINFWGLFEIPIVPVVGGDWEEPMRNLHATGAAVFSGAIALHLLAALYHLLRRDGILRRMGPFPRPASPGAPPPSSSAPSA